MMVPKLRSDHMIWFGAACYWLLPCEYDHHFLHWSRLTFSTLIPRHLWADHYWACKKDGSCSIALSGKKNKGGGLRDIKVLGQVGQFIPNMVPITFFVSDCSISCSWARELRSTTDTLEYSCFLLSLFFQSSSPLFFSSASLWRNNMPHCLWDIPHKSCCPQRPGRTFQCIF